MDVRRRSARARYQEGDTYFKFGFRLDPVAAFLRQAVLLISKIVTGEVIAVLQLGFGAIIAVVLITVGYILRNDTGETTSAESRTEPTG